MFNGQPLPNIYLERGDGSPCAAPGSSFSDFTGLNHMADRDEERLVNANPSRKYEFPFAAISGAIVIVEPGFSGQAPGNIAS